MRVFLFKGMRKSGAGSMPIVTVVVSAQVSEPTRPPMNPVEILEVRCFKDDELPSPLSHAMDDMLRRARQGELHWE